MFAGAALSPWYPSICILPSLHDLDLKRSIGKRKKQKISCTKIERFNNQDGATGEERKDKKIFLICS
jgi:hypothetical protein